MRGKNYENKTFPNRNLPLHSGARYRRLRPARPRRRRCVRRHRLTATLQQSEPLSAFSPELTFQIANSVAIYPDQSAVLVLKDGRKIAKEPSHERKPDENGSGDPAKA